MHAEGRSPLGEETANMLPPASKRKRPEEESDSDSIQRGEVESSAKVGMTHGSKRAKPGVQEQDSPKVPIERKKRLAPGSRKKTVAPFGLIGELIPPAPSERHIVSTVAEFN